MNTAAKQLVAVVLLLGFWEAAVRLTGTAAHHYPVPSGIALNMVRGFSSGDYAAALAFSLARITAGFAIAAAAGIALGLLLASSRSARELLAPAALGVQSLPSICWLPLAVLWFGLSERAVLFVVVMGSLFSVALGVRDGLAQVPPIFRRVGQTFGLTHRQLIVRILLPAAFPGILTGLKQGFSFGWRSLMAGELVYGSTGLGRSLLIGRQLSDVNQVCTVMVLILAIGVAVDRVGFGIIEKRVLARRGLA